jgi:hypothetical protein
MPSLSAVPKFGSPLRNAQFYEQTDSIIRALRPHSTLRKIAERLQEQGLQTPSGKDWNRMRVASYIRNRKLETIATLVKE